MYVGDIGEENKSIEKIRQSITNLTKSTPHFINQK